MSIQSEALQNYFQERRIKNKEVAEALGVSEGTISNILSGRNGISPKIANGLNRNYGLSINFLLYGKGALVPPASIHVNQENVNVGGDNIIASSTAKEAASDTSRLKKMCHELLERIMELEQENCDLRCKLNEKDHD